MSDNPRTTLLEFPCDFPIKVMGKHSEHFAHTVIEVIRAHVPDVDPSRVELRASSSGHYLGVTVTFVAQSQAQLDDVYRALTGHPDVKVVL